MLIQSSAMIGEAVGNFRITDKIAEGGMGVVYRAEHLLIGKTAAVKLLRGELSQNHDVVERFFKEAQAMTALHHAGIVDIYDFGYHSDNRAYIVMELLAGETLKARLQSVGRMSPEDAVRVARSAAGAVGAAHEQGIVHRDLKPDNIFLSPDADMPGGERVKVLDFGLAKLTLDQSASMGTQAGIVLGTPTYMSPEQCDGLGNIDERADQYALGCILYQLLCGRPPFTSKSPFEIITAHRKTTPQSLQERVSGVSPALEAVVMRLLAKTPDERFRNMDELRDALDAVTSVPNMGRNSSADIWSGGHSGAHPGQGTPISQRYSSVSGSNGQMVARSSEGASESSPGSSPGSFSGSSPGSSPGSASAHVRLVSSNSIANPVRMPTAPSTASGNRKAPLYWSLAALASILVGLGIVFAVVSIGKDSQEGEGVLLPAVVEIPVAEQGAAEGEGEATAEPGATDAEAGDAQGGEDEGELVDFEMAPEAIGDGDDSAAEGELAGAGDEGEGAEAAAEDEGDADDSGDEGDADEAEHHPVRIAFVPQHAKVEVDGAETLDRPLILQPRDKPYRVVVSAGGFEKMVRWVHTNRVRNIRLTLKKAEAATPQIDF